MIDRESLLENFAGDLEYHPRRALLYLCLGAAAVSWIFTPAESKFTTLPLIFGLGSLTLILKGIFLLRKSSEGIGLSALQLSELSNASHRKGLPPFTALAAQLVQDFGTGAFLFWPVLRLAAHVDENWKNPPTLAVFLSGRRTVFPWLVHSAQFVASPG